MLASCSSSAGVRAPLATSRAVVAVGACRSSSRVAAASSSSSSSRAAAPQQQQLRRSGAATASACRPTRRSVSHLAAAATEAAAYGAPPATNPEAYIVLVSGSLGIGIGAQRRESEPRTIGKKERAIKPNGPPPPPFNASLFFFAEYRSLRSLSELQTFERLESSQKTGSNSRSSKKGESPANCEREPLSKRSQSRESIRPYPSSSTKLSFFSFLSLSLSSHPFPHPNEQKKPTTPTGPRPLLRKVRGGQARRPHGHRACLRQLPRVHGRRREDLVR
jgi:hypothetical protein